MGALALQLHPEDMGGVFIWWRFKTRRSRRFSPLLHGRHAFTKEAAKADRQIEAPQEAKCPNLRDLRPEQRQKLVRYWSKKQSIDLYERYAAVIAEFEELNTLLREHLNQVCAVLEAKGVDQPLSPSHRFSNRLLMHLMLPKGIRAGPTVTALLFLVRSG